MESVLAVCPTAMSTGSLPSHDLASTGSAQKAMSGKAGQPASAATSRTPSPPPVREDEDDDEDEDELTSGTHTPPTVRNREGNRKATKETEVAGGGGKMRASAQAFEPQVASFQMPTTLLQASCLPCIQPLGIIPSMEPPPGLAQQLPFAEMFSAEKPLQLSQQLESSDGSPRTTATLTLSEESSYMKASWVSVGSAGHPQHCASACRYVKRKGGCKNGTQCPDCHLCFWRRDNEKKAVVKAPPPPAVRTMCPPEAIRDLASAGTMGHPHKCGPPCKYLRRKGGCRNGVNCFACHVCLWRRDRDNAHAASPGRDDSNAKGEDEVPGAVQTTGAKEPIENNDLVDLPAVKEEAESKLVFGDSTVQLQGLIEKLLVDSK